MLHYEVNGYGFTGITDKPEKIRRYGADILFEKTSVEDIMLAYAKERER